MSCYTTSSDPEAPPPDFWYTAIGGLIVEQVTRSNDGKPAQAWRVLTDGECRRLLERKLTPNDLPDTIGSSGRRVIRIDNPSVAV